MAPNTEDSFDLDRWGRQILGATLPIVIADAQLDDHPIVYVNEAFCDLTGYAEHELLGRNCRLLQGDHTSLDARRAIARALAAGEPVGVRILNYRRDGTAFWNDVHIAPTLIGGRPRYFVGTQLDVTGRVLLSDPVFTEEVSALLSAVDDVRSARIQRLIREARAMAANERTA